MQKGSGGLPFRRSLNKNNLRLTGMCRSGDYSKKTLHEWTSRTNLSFSFILPWGIPASMRVLRFANLIFTTDISRLRREFPLLRSAFNKGLSESDKNRDPHGFPLLQKRLDGVAPKLKIKNRQSIWKSIFVC